MKHAAISVIAAFGILPFLVFHSIALSAGEESLPLDFRRQVEADWFLQEQARVGLAILPQEDAAGGCDGVIDGICDFATGRKENM